MIFPRGKKEVWSPSAAFKPCNIFAKLGLSWGSFFAWCQPATTKVTLF